MAAGLGAGIQASDNAITNMVQIQRSNKAWKRSKRLAYEFAQNKHQWAVNDLRKAGLNPILAVGGGIGGGGGPGLNAPMAQIKGGNVAKAATEAFTAPSKKEQQSSQAQANRATADALGARAGRDRAGTITEGTLQEANRSAAAANSANARVYDANAKLLEAQRPAAEGRAELWENPVTRKLMQAREVVAPRGFMAPAQPLPPRGTPYKSRWKGVKIDPPKRNH